MSKIKILKIKLTKNTFSFLLEGTKELVTDKESTKIKNDSFLLMKAGHCLMTEQVSLSDQAYTSILFFFTDDVLFEFLQKNPNQNGVKPIEAKSFYASVYDNFIKGFVNSLLEISHLEPILRQDLLKIKFEEIMTYLLKKQGDSFANFINQKQLPPINHFKQVVENNKLVKLSLQELAFLCNMSQSTFKREFTKHFQESPSKWFQDQRLEHSAYCLTTGKRPLDVYEEAGYESLTNFIQAFKKKFGITPKQYQIEYLT